MERGKKNRGEREGEFRRRERVEKRWEGEFYGKEREREKKGLFYFHGSKSLGYPGGKLLCCLKARGSVRY